MVNNMKSSTVAPPITWFGSKSRLVKQIVNYFPKHNTFVDVFGGSGAILLGKKPSKVEVYNDINQKLVSLFKVLSDKTKTNELIRRLEYTPYSRNEFKTCRDNIDSISDEIELARMMIVVQRQSYGGLAQSWSHCVDTSAAGYSASVRKFHAGIERLKDIHYRIRRTQIENLPWNLILDKYGRKNTLFYLDPPYIHDTRVAGGYEYEMSNIDHIQLVNKLLQIKGNVVLSGYKHEIYNPLEDANWKRIEIEAVAFTGKHRSESTRTECLWLSPKCLEKQTIINELAMLNNEYSNRQIAAYKIHNQRVQTSESLITSAIKSLKKLGLKVTKSEVSKITGISRVHISRRYQYLFDKLGV